MGFRSAAWAGALAQALQRRGVTPNAVSLCSVLFAAMAGACLLGSRRVPPTEAAGLLVLAPAFVGLRALCNLLDGMIAVEGGLRTKSGEVFNDAPDRLSDLILFSTAGYGALETQVSVPAGCLAAALAIMTAYARYLGGALGTPQYFAGPLAKPQRMAVLVTACLAAALERVVWGSTWSLVVGLVVIAVGCGLTIARRLAKIVRFLESR